MTDEKPEPKKPRKPRRLQKRPGFKLRKSVAQKAKEVKWQKQVLALLKKGMPARVAAACAGVSVPNVYKQLKADPEFKDAYYQARGEAQKKLIISDLMPHFKESPASIQWYLARVYRETFGDKSRDKISTRQVYSMFSRMVSAGIEFVDPERRSSFLQAMDDAMSQAEVADTTGNVRKVREKIINGASPIIENDATGDGGGFEE